MRIIMRYDEGDGCTYGCENIHPIEYESCEAALCDFEAALNKAGFDQFEFAGRKFWGDTFYDPMSFNKSSPTRKETYSAPDFLTLDEWYGEKR